MKYPKVLIIGQYFNTNSGGGITLTNLFHGWDKNNIAVAACEISNPDFSVCEKFYNIGGLEIKRGFPFNLIFSQTHSRSGIVNKTMGSEDSAKLHNTELSKLKQIKDNLLLITGQIHRRRRLEISKDLFNWINEFSPDIIYSQLSSLELIRLVATLQKKTGNPLVLHMMDDWPVTITSSQKGIFRLFWAKVINTELRDLFKKADVLLSISESMSDEYISLYGRKFIPFHNPVDLKFWTSATKKEYSFKGNFNILYAGRVGTGLQICLLDLAVAIQNLVNKGAKIEFQVQATTDHPVLKELVKFDFVTLRSQAPYNKLPDIFSEADLLLLPNDFDKNSVAFLKLSMPTKASEYMVSGTPILVFSSSETAVAKHALKYGWGYVVSENSTDKLEAAINKLYNDMDLRMALGYRAKEFALKNYDSEKIREGFKNAVQNNFLHS